MFALLFTLCSISEALVVDSSNVESAFAFQSFEVEYNKNYATEEERDFRFAIFQENLNTIAELNAQRESEHDAFFAVNKFADLTRKEFSSRYLKYTPGQSRLSTLTDAPLNITRNIEWESTDRVDWREQSAVTHVKDQGSCGSCWAFSATEEIESMWFLAGNNLEELSPQQIVSCDKTDSGCNGGDTPTAYDYVIKAGGLELEESYPYTARKSRCSFDASKVVAKISGYTWAVPECEWFHPDCNGQDETKLATALTKSPISICINAEPWQFYSRGVMKRKTCDGKYKDLDHCVQLVGYDQTASEPYWMVRNSWNTDWGIDGYIHLSMGENTCGVADEATVVTV